MPVSVNDPSAFHVSVYQWCASLRLCMLHDLCPFVVYEFAVREHTVAVIQHCDVKNTRVTLLHQVVNTRYPVYVCRVWRPFGVFSVLVPPRR